MKHALILLDSTDPALTNPMIAQRLGASCATVENIQQRNCGLSPIVLLASLTPNVKLTGRGAGKLKNKTAL